VVDAAVITDSGEGVQDTGKPEADGEFSVKRI
jgi:hypothetical protein